MKHCASRVNSISRYVINFSRLNNYSTKTGEKKADKKYTRQLLSLTFHLVNLITHSKFITLEQYKNP